MKSIAYPLVLLALLLQVGCKAHPIDTSNIQAKTGRDAFRLTLTARCLVTPPEHRADFDIMYIDCGGVRKVGIYAGDHTNLDFVDDELTLRPDIDGRSAIVMKDKTDTRIRGYLWKTKFGWPTQLHVWIFPEQLDDPEAQTVAASIRPTLPDAANSRDLSRQHGKPSALSPGQ